MSALGLVPPERAMPVTGRGTPPLPPLPEATNPATNPTKMSNGKMSSVSDPKAEGTKVGLLIILYARDTSDADFWT